jgi:tetratricopeptide (TPR) repeat protein
VLEESRRLSLRHRSYLVELLRTTVDELRDPWLKKRVPERADSLQALGLAYLADDLRVAGRTGQAREKLWEAKRLLNERPCDPEIYATYCEIEADFACARSDRSKTDSPRNDLSQASNFLALAEKYLRDYPIAERAADTLVRRGLLYMRLGNLASAIEAFGAALRAIPAGADPRLRLDALHHSAVAEVRRGGYAAAKRLLEEAKPLYGRHTLPQILVQRDWLWGLVYLDARLYAEAEEALRTAQRGFQRLGMAGDEAPVLTDLQKLYTLTGNLDALDAVRARLSQLTDRTDPVN